jgi:hypothetical protein
MCLREDAADAFKAGELDARALLLTLRQWPAGRLLTPIQ